MKRTHSMVFSPRRWPYRLVAGGQVNVAPSRVIKVPSKLKVVLSSVDLGGIFVPLTCG